MNIKRGEKLQHSRILYINSVKHATHFCSITLHKLWCYLFLPSNTRLAHKLSQPYIRQEPGTLALSDKMVTIKQKKAGATSQTKHTNTPTLRKIYRLHF